MKTEFLDTKQIAKELRGFISDFDEFYWAIAWGSNGPLAEELLAKSKKIRKLVIGISFSQTDPKLLWQLRTCKQARIAQDTGSGIFHPKVYYFQSGDQAAAIVGSANFTRAAVTYNTEAALLLKGSVADGPLQNIRETVERLWKQGGDIDDEFLAWYERTYDANRRHHKALNRMPKRIRPKKNATHPNLLEKSWDDYVCLVKSHADLEKRLNVLHGARYLLDRVDAFSALDGVERQAIAGTVGKKQKKELCDNLSRYDWLLFGSMRGAGAFVSLINSNDSHLSDALDCIPRREKVTEVTEDDYWAFIEEFERAFRKSKRKGSVPTASRLLAMKRPDYFVCVDSKNRKMMSCDLGFARTTIDFKKYWYEIIEPITQAKWWQARPPKGEGTEGRIWDGRAAMLDIICYEPT